MVRVYQVIIAVLFVTLVVGAYVYHSGARVARSIQGEHDSIAAELSQAHTRIADLEGLVEEREEQLNANKEFIKTLREQSAGAQYDFGRMLTLIQEATGTVADIKRLEEADERLLAKYSKVYFLNEHYAPELRSAVPEKYVMSSRTLEIHANVLPFLARMLDAMERAEVPARVVSSYRSFGYQEDLKHRHTVTYGSESANTFVATQGYSEHQLGTTVDLSTPQLGDDLLGFSNTDAYAWLRKNAHTYGFVLSYPEGNQYYAFEPWHWRFVGISLTTWLYNEKKAFYDASQRDINAYLLEMFEG